MSVESPNPVAYYTINYLYVYYILINIYLHLKLYYEFNI